MRVLSREIPPAVARIALIVIALNLVDAFCTLEHLQRGAVELNPLMRLLLGISPLAFLLGKYALACGGVLGIVAQARHEAANQVLRFVLLPVYAAIGVYQIALFALV